MMMTLRRNNERHRPSHFLGIVCRHVPPLVAIVVCGGCAALYYPAHPQWYGYVLDMGPPEKITQWTLRQSDEDKIQDGMSALLDRAMSPDPAVAGSAIGGYVRVYEKAAEGWPGFVPRNWRTGPVNPSVEDMAEPQRARALEITIVDLAFELLAVQAADAPQNPLLREAFFRIRPPAQDPTRYKAWEEAGRTNGLLPAAVRPPG